MSNDCKLIVLSGVTSQDLEIKKKHLVGRPEMADITAEHEEMMKVILLLNVFTVNKNYVMVVTIFKKNQNRRHIFEV